MKTLMGLVAALAIPLMILNTLGGLVAGVWLAILGEWGRLGIGVAIFFFATGFLGFALTPGMLLAAPAALCAQRGNTGGMVGFAALSSLYILALITTWCCAVLFFFVRDATDANLVPSLLWSYVLATGPWAYMASKDSQSGGADGFGSLVSTFLAQLAYVTIMIIIIFSSITLVGALKVFGGFMTVAFLVQLVFAVAVYRQQQSPGL